MKYKTRRVLGVLVQKTIIISIIVASVAVAKWTNDGTGAVVVLLFGVPILFSKTDFNK